MRRLWGWFDDFDYPDGDLTGNGGWDSTGVSLLVDSHSVTSVAATGPGVNTVSFIDAPPAEHVRHVAITLTQSATGPYVELLAGDDGMNPIFDIQLDPFDNQLSFQFGSDGLYQPAATGNDGLPHTWRIISDGSSWWVTLDDVVQFTNPIVALPPGRISFVRLTITTPDAGTSVVHRVEVGT